MKKYFLELPMGYMKYPERVVELADKAGVSVEDVAKRDGITMELESEPIHWRFDLISMIIRIMPDPDVDGCSLAELESGEILFIKMNHDELAEKIGEFMIENDLQSEMLVGGDVESEKEEDDV